LSQAFQGGHQAIVTLVIRIMPLKSKLSQLLPLCMLAFFKILIGTVNANQMQENIRHQMFRHGVSNLLFFTVEDRAFKIIFVAEYLTAPKDI
jgi:hypothetical protein